MAPVVVSVEMMPVGAGRISPGDTAYCHAGHYDLRKRGAKPFHDILLPNALVCSVRGTRLLEAHQNNAWQVRWVDEKTELVIGFVIKD